MIASTASDGATHQAKKRCCCLAILPNVELLSPVRGTGWVRGLRTELEGEALKYQP
jgi:hypothetical protein